MIVDVQPAEYYRLLGYPADHIPAGRACELAAAAHEWYQRNGRPWVHTRAVESLSLGDGTVRIDGIDFTSRRLQRSLQEAQAHGAVLAAVSAGPEAEEEAQKLWRADKPDEYFFLEVFASAVVERLITTAGAQLCASSEPQGIAVLPHYSPGYSEWDIAEQGRLLSLLGGLPGPLEALDSGALRPKKSQLAVFGLTRDARHLRRLTDLLPCESCSFGPCQYRRAPYRRQRPGLPEPPVVASAAAPPSYTVNVRALRRWAAERLSLETNADGAIDARFRYDGTTCSNLGRPLAFDYAVKLGPRQSGYPILEQRCAPAPRDTGHTHMCQYVANAVALTDAIRRETPLLGQPLDDVLSWRRSTSGAGCYCDSASREHKWGLVLETIHYALHNANL
jgi:hypothetical protein